MSKRRCDLYCLYFLLLSSISIIAGNSSQLLFLGRPGNPFPAFLLTWSITRPWDGHNMYALIHAIFLISHHFHVYTSWKGAALHHVENTFILRLSCLHMFKKLNSNRGVNLFQIFILGTFSSQVCCRNETAWFFFRITSLGQILLQSSSIPKIEKTLHFTFSPHYKSWKKLHFKISSNFSRVLFVLNIQRWTKWNRLLWVGMKYHQNGYCEFVINETTSIPYWTSLLWKPLFSTLLEIDDITLYELSKMLSK
jgi:hypothetical protein